MRSLPKSVLPRSAPLQGGIQFDAPQLGIAVAALGFWSPGCFALIANAFAPVPPPLVLSGHAASLTPY